MSLLMVDQGEAIALKALLNHTAGENFIICLYKSNTTPAETDTEATYTVADFTGYSQATLTGSSWTVSGTTTATYAQQTFTSSAGSQNQSVYGYFYKQASSGKLVIAERFSDGPYVIVNNGDNIKVTPTITCD